MFEGGDYYLNTVFSVVEYYFEASVLRLLKGYFGLKPMKFSLNFTYTQLIIFQTAQVIFAIPI